MWRAWGYERIVLPELEPDAGPWARMRDIEIAKEFRRFRREYWDRMTILAQLRRIIGYYDSDFDPKGGF